MRAKQKILAVLLLALVAVSVSHSAFALGVATEGVLDQVELRAAGEAEAAGEEIRDEGGLFEEIIAGLIKFPVRVVKSLSEKVLKLKDINVLVFGEGNGLWHDHSLWTESEARFIRAVYWSFASICLPFFLVVIITTGFKLLYGAANPGAREEAISSIWRWFAVMIMILAVPLVTDLVLSLSGVLTDAIRIAFEGVSNSSGTNASLGDFSNKVFKGDIDIKTGSVIGTALVEVFFAFLWLWFNIIYFIRKVVLSVMVCFAPVAGLFWAINRNVPAVAIWFGELGSNALMPVAHAIVLCVVLGLTDLKNVSKGGSWFHVLIAMYLLMPLAETIRNSVQSLFVRWAGVDESGVASRATMAALGLGGLISLGRLAGSVAGGPPPAAPPPPPATSPGSGVQQFPIISGGSPGRAAAYAGAPAGFAGIPVNEKVPGYEITPSGLYVPYGATGQAGAGSAAAEAAGVGGFTAGTGGALLRSGNVAAGTAGAGETGSFAAGTEAPAAGGGAAPGGVLPLGSAAGQEGRPEEKPFWGRVADRTVTVGAGIAGGMAGWVVKTAAGAVPGVSPAGQRLGDQIDRAVSSAFRAGAGSVTIAAKAAGDWRVPRPDDRYLSGNLRKDAANIFSATAAMGRGRMNASDLMYASTLEEAVQSVQPRYSNAKKKLA